MPTPVWISLGGNLGDRHAILDEALNLLNETPGVTVTQVSSFRETLPVGGPPGQGAFLNAAARLDTTLTPRALLEVTQGIENQLGRVRTVRWGERTLDVDILIYGSDFTDEPDLKLPHPRLAIRRFVLVPLVEIAPEAVDVRTRRTVAELLARLNRRPFYLAVDESIQLKAPRLLIQLERLLPGVLIPNSRIMRGETLESARCFDWVNWTQARIESTDQAITQCSVDHPNRWLLKTTHLKTWSVDLASPRINRASDRNARQPAIEDEIQLARRLADLPSPTLVVASPPPLWRAHRINPANVPIPIYWPEAIEPAAIVAEIVAVCRGIEAV